MDRKRPTPLRTHLFWNWSLGSIFCFLLLFVLSHLFVCVRVLKLGDTSLCFLCVYDVYRMICEKVRREFGYEKGFETGDGYTKPRYANAWPVPGS